MSTELLPRTTINRVCSYRNAAIAKMREAAETIAKGHALAAEAEELAEQAHANASFLLADRSQQESYQRLFQGFNLEASLETYRRQIDARVWMNLIAVTGIQSLMDRTAKDALYNDLCNEVPEVNEETARATFEALAGDAKLIFQRGLARAFSDLDRRFKSHDAFKLGSRVVLENVFDNFGHVSFYSRMADTIADIERTFAVLDGETHPDPGALMRAIREDRQSVWAPHQSYTETRYFRVRCFKKGSVHLWFKRDDLVKAANLQLADYYGDVLPDAVPDDVSEQDLYSKSKELAKDLSFYPTPQAVVKNLLQNTWIKETCHVLEPSAGTGHIVRTLLEKGAKVDAIEIHPDRVKELEALNHPRLQVTAANFLQVPAQPIYTHVIMNPPFYGTHWMQHVTHAFDFLKPGGKLIAVLPITAELGQSKKHIAFRKWAQIRTRYGTEPEFRDLPAESFRESGTRINTVFLTLYKSH